MRHRVAGRRLGRDTKQRKALRRAQISQLLEHEKIHTTVAKAKSLRPPVEKLITIARNRGDAERLIELAEDGDEEMLQRLLTTNQAARLLKLAQDGEDDELSREANAIAVHAQRLVAKEVHDKAILYKLFHDIAPRYVDRPGGYTRIVRAGYRKGDSAEMAYIMLVEED
jgi:large subunit ribosomal protein L17